ncbi:MAG: ATP-binding protein [Acidobacteriota bacterium]
MTVDMEPGARNGTIAAQAEAEIEGAGPARNRLFSAPGRLIALLIPALLVYSGLVAAGLHFTEFPPWLILLVAAGASLPLTVWAVGAFLNPVMRTVQDLSDGIRAFQDRDFSLRIATRRTDELGELVRLYNQVGEILREERQQIRQRELLLQTAMDQSPIAIVLVNPLDRVIYANQEARRLFLGGRRLGGLHFHELLDACPPELRQVLDGGEDGMFTARIGEEVETYHLAQRSFSINRRRHSLILLRRMTAELARQEAEIWKKVIRIISHELNNSLAPISSLAHSARTLVQESDEADRLEPIYLSIRERIDHLTEFLEGYARFARLPRPEKEEVLWLPWLEGPRELYPFELVGDTPPEPGYFDASQMQQVLINLLKNAREASPEGEPIRVAIHRRPAGGFVVQVSDGGRGMDEEVMRQALLPFYSTKQTGTGVGLPLCREIVEAHGGSLRIQSRPGQGTTVSFWIPGPGGR